MVNVLLSLAPVLLIIVLLMRKTPADIAGWCGFILALGIAFFYFNTPIGVLLRASGSGFFASFPVALCISASIFQIIVMTETGALARIVASLKCLTPGTLLNSQNSGQVTSKEELSKLNPDDKIVQLLILNFALGTMLTALGAVTISIFPPIMIALGYSAFISIVLPCIGYQAFCSYALLSVPAMVLAQLSGMSLEETARTLAMFMPYAAVSVALVMLWFTGGIKMVIKGLVPALLAGLASGFACILVAEYNLLPLTGVIAGLAAVIVLLIYERLRNRRLFDSALMNEKDLVSVSRLRLLSALSPWIILTIASLLMNWPSLPFFKFFFAELSMPLEIFPGRPEKIRLFWQAYFWIVIATLISIPFMKAKYSVVKSAGKRWAKIAWRPFSAATVYFALAYVMNLSGYSGEDFTLHDPSNNMINILAVAAAQTFQQYYSIIAPYFGLLAGFISGSQSSAIAMLTALHISTAKALNLDFKIIAAAGAIGGGLASLLSPTKLLSAAATIGKAGEEGSILKACIVPSLLLVAVIAVLSWLWS
ncbi:L-lactate permease [Desulfovibrio litoralis]|uniref:L-lactate permease n=1 Tax=Desulfovibrio litoralis DSM 11393 TaxID=1121455 RepID=A0A1M7SXV6_9BACT|nr:L-lactate permease [Desulfovibrio litoralis]SHN63271.1 lactate permease [Desulfovibrio litoralis DSM 11393]